MKKRIAYIGLSYPLLYDYEHQAERAIGDMASSPNPIIESPLGLMVLYDELIFTCRSICPNNMRNLPYVKFLDEMYPDFYFAGAFQYMDDFPPFIELNQTLSFTELVKLMHVENWGVDIHTHALKIGDVVTSAKPIEDSFMFDLYVYKALKEQYSLDVELITNSNFSSAAFNGGVGAEFADRVIINEIPNYLAIDGPYHPCMDELRDSSNLKAFRRWIIQEHGKIQRSEISDVCNEISEEIEKNRKKYFRKFLNENTGFVCFKSSSSTFIKTLGGLYVPAISIVDALGQTIAKRKDYLEAESIRWQGFVMDSRNIMEDNFK